ncbi:NUDIX domain-containing protein [Phyllobacterium myrsinacearum]|uniref:8-oxo-dGTP pyrophosphatase MutT (NUDIX family) n=1 Tax=Phyllobacterium myrsinacearum TaxID=28101 RepID=A0A839EVD2_9HYPH|nr:NUDIX domain-containing protein [Phyllobacterium myrsinacearum]MBA8882055.1 8-oxo-dGTP pyrophosphatase MutT (NUDIX family) [Phyllobacterium myrsinacearum]
MLRRKGTGWMDGLFSIPAGGLEADEIIGAAAIREACEEVGVQIEPVDLQYVHTLHSNGRPNMAGAFLSGDSMGRHPLVA